MPYIVKQARPGVLATGPQNPGELTYLLTEAAIAYLEHVGLDYRGINDVMGAFACASQEFYRRVAVPYEDNKCRQNGDLDWPVR